MKSDENGSAGRMGVQRALAALALMVLAACEDAPAARPASLLSTPLHIEGDTTTFEPMELGAPVSTPEPAVAVTLVDEPEEKEDDSDPYAYPAWKGFDLDCADVGHSVKVTGSDPHRLDRDGDGWGCESY